MDLPNQNPTISDIVNVLVPTEEAAAFDAGKIDNALQAMANCLTYTMDCIKEAKVQETGLGMANLVLAVVEAGTRMGLPMGAHIAIALKNCKTPLSIQ